MKKSLISLAFLSLSLSPSIFAKTPFNGYIVKYKSGAEKSLKSFENFKKLNVDFANFALIKPTQKINIKSLEADPNIEYIEPNYIISIKSETKNSVTVTDPDFSKQWGLNNTGKNSKGPIFPGKAGEDVNALKAWEITQGSKDILIAVIDTGIDYNHPDLQDNRWVNEAEKNGTEGVDDDGNGYIDDIYGYDFANNDGDPIDGNGHGTHCAGVIGASHNDIGISGIMKNTRIAAVKFLKDTGAGETQSAIEAISYATKIGVDIMSNSWAGGEYTRALQEVIQHAADQGIIFVVAAGNTYSNTDRKPIYPAAYEVDNILTVGAMKGNGLKALFSNYGSKSVDVFAPGKNILSTVENGEYEEQDGTSMATPHVSGVLGLLLSHEKGIDYKSAIERIKSTSVKTRSLKRYSVSGRVDAFRMLENQVD